MTKTASGTPLEGRTSLVLLTVAPDETGGLPQSGRSGYVLDLSDPERIMRVVDALRNGATPEQGALRRVRVTVHAEECHTHGLSPRELEVLGALTEGLSYKMIADRLAIRYETVRSHMKGIYAKMGVNNNTAAVAKAINGGLVAA